MSEHAAAPGNGGLEFDEVVIDGVTYRVRQEVCDEIINVRRGAAHEIIERIRAIRPAPTDTIIITTPGEISAEFVGMVGATARQNFPDNQIAVLPEQLQLHTQEGFARAVDLGMQLATAVQENNPGAAKPIADAYVKLLNEGPEPEGEEANDTP
jgi:hypothetical protein